MIKLGPTCGLLADIASASAGSAYHLVHEEPKVSQQNSASRVQLILLEQGTVALDRRLLGQGVLDVSDLVLDVLVMFG
jgi:hypothetical protein